MKYLIYSMMVGMVFFEIGNFWLMFMGIIWKFGVLIRNFIKLKEILFYCDNFLIWLGL